MKLFGKGVPPTFVVLKNGGGPRYEVVAWGHAAGKKDIMLSPVGGGKDIIVSEQEYRDKYIKAD